MGTDDSMVITGVDRGRGRGRGYRWGPNENWFGVVNTQYTDDIL